MFEVSDSEPSITRPLTVFCIDTPTSAHSPPDHCATDLPALHPSPGSSSAPPPLPPHPGCRHHSGPVQSGPPAPSACLEPHCRHHSGPVQSGPVTPIAPSSTTHGVFQAALTPPSSRLSPLPSNRLLVDLFAGASAPVSEAAAALSMDRILLLDLLHGVGFDLADSDAFSSLCELAASGLVGAAIAAPPCSAFSRARLRPGGPRAVRTLQYPCGIPYPSVAQQRELDSSRLLHFRTRHVLALVASRGGIICLENPSSSILWLDPTVRDWLLTHAPFSAHVAACQHNVNLSKAWTFWSNYPIISKIASVCPHGPGAHPSFAGKRLPDGSFASRHTACYPASLAAALAKCFQPYTSCGGLQVHPRQWRRFLPAQLAWPLRPHRIEDGAGTCSSAFWRVPRYADVFRPLRQAWMARLCRDDMVSRIITRLNSDSKQPPLSVTELQPFLSDLRCWLGVAAASVWTQLLHVDSGQPFRFSLWHSLALICSDPDVDLFTVLHSGVPLKVNSPIPVCPVLPPPEHLSEPSVPLQHCESAWKSALDHADIVDTLLASELAEGWIEEIPGGDVQLRQDYPVTAVGKLGVVTSSDRPPRLVVDSSVSGVTCHTKLPNKSPNPTLSDVRQCLPLSPAREDLTALVLDVSKAHRRIRIRPEDQGLLCFRHRGKLYKSVTLNFGARASGHYWSRVAGLLVRLAHRLLFIAHSAFIYVDDILALLERSSAPLTASVLIILLQVLCVPMSWHKASLRPTVVWIGWQFNFTTFTVTLDPPKLQRLLCLISEVLSSRRSTVTQLERLTGKLLWLSSLFRTFRPTLAPLYADVHSPMPSMSAISPDVWHSVRASLSADMIVSKPLPLAALRVGCKLLRVGHVAVGSLEDLPEFPSARRLWLQVANPAKPDRILSDASVEVLQLWRALCSSGDSFRPLLPHPLFACTAYADACADSSCAGLGGYVRLPDGSSGCFQARFSPSDLQALAPWFPASESPQHFIAAWELLAQLGLLWTLVSVLPVGHMPMHVTFRTDNSATDSASWKGLSMAKGMCHVLQAFFYLQERHYISVHLDAVPGFLNDTADQLSRFISPATLGFPPQSVVDIPWQRLLAKPDFCHFPSDSPMPRFLASSG